MQSMAVLTSYGITQAQELASCLCKSNALLY